MAGNKELVEGLYEAFARGDVPTVLAALADDVEWHEAENTPYYKAGGYRGGQEVLEGVFARLGQDFDGFSVHPIRLHEADDTVLAEGRYKGTSKSTGKVLDAQLVHVWQLRDGKVVRWQQYTDSHQWREVLG